MILWSVLLVHFAKNLKLYKWFQLSSTNCGSLYIYLVLNFSNYMYKYILNSIIFTTSPNLITYLFYNLCFLARTLLHCGKWITKSMVEYCSTESSFSTVIISKPKTTAITTFQFFQSLGPNHLLLWRQIPVRT